MSRVIRPHRIACCLTLGLALSLFGCATSTAPPPTVTFTAVDYSFSGPASVPAGLTTFRLENHGHHAHQLALVQIDPGHDMTDTIQAYKQDASAGCHPGRIGWAARTRWTRAV